MNVIEELTSVIAYVQNPAARRRLDRVICKIRSDAEAEKAAKPKKRVTNASHAAAVAAGKEARAAGHGKDGVHRAGSLQERTAWLAGWNDEDIRRGGK